MRFLAILALALVPSACKVSDYATPEQTEQIANFDQVFNQAVLDLQDTEEQIQDTKVSAAEAAAAGDAEAFQELLSQLELLGDRYDADLALALEAKENAEAVESEAFQDETLAFKVLADRFVPGSGFFVGALAPLAVGMFTRRGRKRTVEAVKYTAIGEVRAGLASFAKALGWRHSDDDPQALRERADKLAAEKAKKARKVLAKAQAAAEEAGDALLASDLEYLQNTPPDSPGA